jgi:hypothetical protein
MTLHIVSTNQSIGQMNDSGWWQCWAVQYRLSVLSKIFCYLSCSFRIDVISHRRHSICCCYRLSTSSWASRILWSCRRSCSSTICNWSLSNESGTIFDWNYAFFSKIYKNFVNFLGCFTLFQWWLYRTSQWQHLHFSFYRQQLNAIALRLRQNMSNLCKNIE